VIKKMILRYLPALLLLLLFINTQAQQLVKGYVKNNTRQILTIDPDSTGYSDLRSIGDAIGDAKIVMLGEQEHGDAATFLAKSRLVKYLHEEKGFDVLAFESDFYGLNEGWDKLTKTKENIDSFIYKNVFPTWTLCHTCNNLFYTYISKTFGTGNPLQISGIDCQFYGTYSSANFVKQFQLYFNKYEGLEKNIAAVLPLLDSLIIPHFIKTTTTTARLAYNLGIIYNRLIADANVSKFWLQVLKSYISCVTGIQAHLEKQVKNYRDMQMADNLDWLCRIKYPDEKIIVWAANAHIAKNAGNTFDFFSKENVMMGSYVDRNPFLKDKVYRIGFTSYKGYNWWAEKKRSGHPVELPYKKSFENWINKSYDYAFVDFKKFNRLNPGTAELFFMKGSTQEPHHNQYFNWNNIFDGLFFIRNMYGCK